MNQQNQCHESAPTKFVIELQACTSLFNLCMTHKSSEGIYKMNQTHTYVKIWHKVF